MGAWIEMLTSYYAPIMLYCRTPQGCVDWNDIKELGKQLKKVAPLKGAWIEIPFDAYITNLGKLRPTRARRLKFVKCTQLTEMVWKSHTARVRLRIEI